jgi:hypothetical protein
MGSAYLVHVARMAGALPGGCVEVAPADRQGGLGISWATPGFVAEKQTAPGLTPGPLQSWGCAGYVEAGTVASKVTGMSSQPSTFCFTWRNTFLPTWGTP